MKKTNNLWRILGYILIPAIFFVFGSGSLRAQNTYKKISEATELAAGDEVIIVGGTSAFNGQISSAPWGLYVSVTISNGDEITASVGSSETDYSGPRPFIVEFNENQLSLRDKFSGKYLQGVNGSNTISYSTTPVAITLTTNGIHDEAADANLRLNGNSGFRFYKSNGTTGTISNLYKKQVLTTPFVITDANEVSYKFLPTENLNETLRFTAGNLENNLTVSVASATEGKPAVITVTPTTLSKETTSFDLTLTTSGLAEGEYSDIITIKSGAETMATVTVNLKVEMTYPYKKITTLEELTEGGKYLIVNDDKKVALSASSDNGVYQTQTAVNIEVNTIEERGDARELTLIKKDDNWLIYDADANEYLALPNDANELRVGTSSNEWKIEFDAGNATITSTAQPSRTIRHNSSSTRFACYTNGQNDIQLYKKQEPEAPAPCEQVTNVQTTVTATNITLTWDAPANAPANGYKVHLTDEEEAMVAGSEQTVTETTYTFEGLTAGMIYTYHIVSLCSQTSFSEEVEDIFETPLADAKTLSVSLSGDKENGIYTGAITFTFTTSNNFKIGEDGKISYTIIGGDDYEKEGEAAEKTLTLNDFSVGEYMAEFELVDMEGEPFDVSVSKTFSVKLPSVKAPVFSPAEQTAAFTTAQTITLSSETPEAEIFYAINADEFTAYPQTGIELNESGTYVIKAYATKAGMDNSATVTKTYKLDLPIVITGDIVFEEPFESITATADGSKKLDNILDNYTNMPGWSGANVYEGKGGCVKLGGSSALGYIETPAIDLTENEGKFILSFDAKAYDNDNEKDNIKLIVNGQEQAVSGLPKTEMKTFVFAFTSGTEATTIRFSAAIASKNRFYLDNIKIYQQLPNEASISVVSSLTLKTIQDKPVSQKVSVKGKLLEEDVTVTCPEGNFSVSPTTLSKEALMGAGAELTVMFNGEKPSDEAVITLTSGTITKTIKVTATAENVVTVNDLASLRAGTQNTLYKVKGEVVVTAMDSYRNYKWIQDATGAILIDDNTNLVTTSYQVGDGITDVYGRLGNFGGQLQLVMVGNLPEASSHNNEVEPELLTIEELTENIDDYCSRLVKIKGLTLLEPEGDWTGNTDNWAMNANEDLINIRTFVRNGNFVGTEKPQGSFDLIAIAGVYNGDLQVSPRWAKDIIVGGDACEAPSALKIAIDPENLTATATWKGSVENYRVVLLSGTDTLEDATVSNKTYTFTKAQAQVEYGWAVASVCEAGKLIWTKGKSFTIQNTGIEEANTLQADVYPNPTDGVVYIRLVENARMEIFTLGGMMLRSEELSSGSNEIRLTQSGIYFIRLSNGTTATVKRVVVR